MAGGGYAGAGWRPTPTRCLRTLVSRLQSPTFITAFARRTKVSSYPPPQVYGGGPGLPMQPCGGKGCGLHGTGLDDSGEQPNLFSLLFTAPMFPANSPLSF